MAFIVIKVTKNCKIMKILFLGGRRPYMEGGEYVEETFVVIEVFRIMLTIKTKASFFMLKCIIANNEKCILLFSIMPYIFSRMMSKVPHVGLPVPKALGPTDAWVTALRPRSL